jgi:phosphoglycerol transferase MdoB-like AlkP superfamily enzyme
MADLGYQTFGLHGFSGMMFDRERWWQMVGLQQATFAENTKVGAPYCGGAFRGICDGYMLEQALQMLREPNRFVYLLTLNTHLPLTIVNLPSELKALCREQQVSESVCQLTGQLGAFLAQTRAGLEKLQQAPLVVVVGDHSPPFLVQDDRRQFMATRVPRFILVPR